jgi:hypothetical protein
VAGQCEAVIAARWGRPDAWIVIGGYFLLDCANERLPDSWES